MTFPTVSYDVKQTAAALRKALRDEFGGVTFTVRMARGTAYGWLDVGWADGPTVNAVRKVCDRFESERFDGMDDSYHAVEPTMFLIDGVPTVVRYSCRGVTTQRDLSPEALAWAAAQVAANPGRWEHDYDTPGETYYACRRLLQDTDLRDMTIKGA